MLLLQLAERKDLSGVRARLATLGAVLPPTPQILKELLERNGDGFTPLQMCLCADAPYDLISPFYELMKGDPVKRNLFSIPNDFGTFPLHICAINTNSVAVLQFVYERFPHAIVRRSLCSSTPLMYAERTHTDRRNHAAIVRFLKENLAAYPALQNQTAVKFCMMKMKEEGMTEYVAARSINELTRPQFVYMVLDHMKNCAMEPLAENILQHVGVGGAAKAVAAKRDEPSFEDWGLPWRAQKSLCDFCGFADGKLRCSRCKSAHYCSGVCQKRHWREHKMRCVVNNV